jgi:hypothetical protein
MVSDGKCMNTGHGSLLNRAAKAGLLQFVVLTLLNG